MAHIVDVRGSGGSLVVLGGALTLPNSANSASSVASGSIRYNSTTSVIEVYTGSTWIPTTGSGSGVLTFNGRPGAVTLRSSDISTALGYVPLGSTSSLSYAALPESLKYNQLIYSRDGLQPIAQQAWTIPVVQPFTLPINCANSAAICGSVGSTSSASFTMAYTRNSITVTIGTITFSPGSSVGVFTTNAYTAQVGDVLTLTTPVAQNASLANVGIVVLGTRTT